MEYVDNSLDDTEKAYRANGDRYPREISIRVRIDRKNRRVAVVDNCREAAAGMLGLSRTSPRA